MDINTLRGISTVFVMLAFLAIFVWVYLIKSKRDYDEAANSPFADELDAKVQPESDPISRTTEELK